MIAEALRRSFACDLRSLAMFRLAIGAAAIDFAVSRPWSNTHTAFDSTLVTGLVVASVLMILGYHTRLVTFFCWILASLITVSASTDPSSQERLLIVLLFLASWVPLGGRYSLDAAMALSVESENRFSSLTTAAFLLQLGVVLLVSALSLQQTDLARGEFLGGITKFLGLCAPALIFTPVATDWGRLVMVAGLLCVAVASAATHGMAIEPYLLVAMAALSPSILWDYLSSLIRRRFHVDKLRIYFDQECGFCEKICLVFREFFLLGKATVEPAQSNPEIHAVMREFNSWVVYDYDDSRHVRWHAVILLLRRSPLFWPVGQVLHALGMGNWGDIIYEAIARLRGTLSRLTAVLLPRRQTLRLDRISGKVVVLAWLFAVVLFNSSPARGVSLERIPVTATVLVLRQDWTLFLSRDPIRSTD